MPTQHVHSRFSKLCTASVPKPAPAAAAADCVLRFHRSEIKLVNVWCIYGYSLTIFIPMAFVCIVPIGWVRWLAVMLATGMSGLFIVVNLKQTIYEAAPARALVLLGAMLALHLGVGLALRLYFFRYRGVPEVVTG